MSRKNLKIILAVLLATILGLTAKPNLALAGWTQGKFNYAIDFNGQSTWVEIPHTISNIKTLSFWIKPDNLNQKILQLADGVYIEISNGEISLTGFGSAPKIYIDAQSKTTLTTNWHHLVIVADTSITGSAIQIGKTTISATDYYFDGIIDDVRIYSYERTLDEIRLDYNAGLAVKLGGSPSQINWTYETQWLYKREITISGSTSDLTDYQVSLTLDTQSLISQGKMRSDCGDIRFGDTTGKVLNYWIEPNTCNTTSTKIWVKIPSIPTSGTTIYLYYGNSSVSSQSNAQSTFIRIIDGVVGSWHFDEGSGTTAYDTSGNDNDGSLTNMDPDTDWVDGKFGKALSFDGTDDYIDCGNPSSLDLSGKSKTVECWVNLDTYNSASYYHRLVSQAVDANNGYQLISGDEWDLAGKTFAFVVEKEGSRYAARIKTKKELNTWYHVVGTFDNDTNTPHIYVNGVLDDESYESEAATGGVAGFNIGRRVSGNSYLDGLIDEVRIYNSALTAEEISDLYNNYGYTTENYPGRVLVRKYASPEPTATVGDEQSTLMPVAHWRFDEGSGSTAYDSTPNHNNGTISGATFAEGKFGSAVSFDGTDDYLVTQSALNSQSQFSYSLWFQSSDGEYSTNEYLFNQGTDDPSAYIDNNGDLNIKINSSLKCQISNPNLKSQKWNHLEITGDGSTLKVYLNGSLTCKTSYSGSTAEDILYLGSASSTAGFFGGKIDDFRIYGYARSPQQVKIDYNAGFGIKLGGSPSPDITRGLVAYYNFDEGFGTTLHDISGTGNSGTLVNGPNWTKGKYGGALKFDGTDDYVNCGKDESLNITDAITIAAWVKASAYAGDGRIIVDKNSRYFLGLLWNGKPQFRLYLSTLEYSDLVADDAVTLDQWYHLVGTYDMNGGANNQKFYINGEEKKNATQTASIQDNLNFILYMGGSPSRDPFNGLIDEVRIYNRALSEEEIRYLYNKGKPEHQWKFEEGEGSTAHDSGEPFGGNDCSLSGTSFKKGILGTGLYFSGSASSSCGDIGNIKTLSFFINPLSLNQPILDLDGGTNYIELSSGKIHLAGDGWQSPKLYVNGKQIPLDTNNYSINTLSQAQWYHIEIVNSASISVSALTLGKVGTSYFVGTLDEIRAYNYQRTPDQVKIDFNSGLGIRFK